MVWDPPPPPRGAELLKGALDAKVQTRPRITHSGLEKGVLWVAGPSTHSNNRTADRRIVVVVAAAAAAVDHDNNQLLFSGVPRSIVTAPSTLPWEIPE